MAQARRSALAGRNAATSPVATTPSAPQEATEAPESTAEPSAPPSAPADAANPPEQPSAASKGKRKKVSFYQHVDEEARARAAWMHTMGHTGHTTITSFMEAAVANYTRMLEAEYNDSKPF